MKLKNPNCIVCGEPVPIELLEDVGVAVIKSTHDGQCFEAFLNMQYESIRKKQLLKKLVMKSDIIC